MQPDHDSDELQTCLLEEYEAPPLDEQFSAGLIARLQAEVASVSAPAGQSPRRALRSPATAGRVKVACAAIVVSALVLATGYVAWRPADDDGNAIATTQAVSALPTDRTPGVHKSVAIPAAKNGGVDSMALLPIGAVVKTYTPRATVIFVATALGSTPASGPGVPTDRFIYWIVKRVIKGKLTEDVFTSRAWGPVVRTRMTKSYRADIVQRNYVGRETIVMLFARRYAAGASLFHVDHESQIKAQLGKGAIVGTVADVLKPRTAAELNADWRDLSGKEAAAFPAMGRLVASPGNAVAFLGTRLKSTLHAQATPQQRISRLIDNLDHRRFHTREQATKELQALGHVAGPALWQTLAGNPSPECKARVTALLARLKAAPTPEMLRTQRAVQAMEFIGTPEALRLLKKLAAGPPSWLGEQAQAAVRRITRPAAAPRPRANHTQVDIF